MIDTYEIYRQWCADHGRASPTREWWDMACALNKPVRPTAQHLDNAEIEREAREGWVDLQSQETV